jgi:hypothetical protein
MNSKIIIKISAHIRNQDESEDFKCELNSSDLFRFGNGKNKEKLK